jgi:hypothetical protein
MQREKATGSSFPVDAAAVPEELLWAVVVDVELSRATLLPGEPPHAAASRASPAAAITAATAGVRIDAPFGHALEGFERDWTQRVSCFCAGAEDAAVFS